MPLDPTKFLTDPAHAEDKKFIDALIDNRIKELKEADDKAKKPEKSFLQSLFDPK